MDANNSPINSGNSYNYDRNYHHHQQHQYQHHPHHYNNNSSNNNNNTSNNGAYSGLPNHFIEERQDVIFRKVRGILNKITPETFDKLSKELVNVGLDSPRTLRGLIYLLFDKALKDLKYSSLYAKLCQELSEKAPNFEQEPGPNTFCKFLISKCEDEFERRRKATEDFDCKNELTDEEYEQRAIVKQKMLGNIKFICELGKKQLLQEEILHECIRGLLSKKKERPIQDQAPDLECLCQIMRTIGSLLDVNASKNLMNQYFERIDMFSKKPELPSRIRFMLRDVIDLRNNNWRPRPFQRVEDNVPQTLSRIRESAGLDPGPGSAIDKFGNSRNLLNLGDLSKLHGDKLSMLLDDEPSFTTSSDFHWGPSFLPIEQHFDAFSSKHETKKEVKKYNHPTSNLNSSHTNSYPQSLTSSKESGSMSNTDSQQQSRRLDEQTHFHDSRQMRPEIRRNSRDFSSRIEDHHTGGSPQKGYHGPFGMYKNEQPFVSHNQQSAMNVNRSGRRDTFQPSRDVNVSPVRNALERASLDPDQEMGQLHSKQRSYQTRQNVPGPSPVQSQTYQQPLKLNTINQHHSTSNQSNQSQQPMYRYPRNNHNDYQDRRDYQPGRRYNPPPNHYEHERPHFSRHFNDRANGPFHGQQDSNSFRPYFNRNRKNDDSYNANDCDKNLNWRRQDGPPAASQGPLNTLAQPPAQMDQYPPRRNDQPSPHHTSDHQTPLNNINRQAGQRDATRTLRTGNISPVLPNVRRQVPSDAGNPLSAARPPLIQPRLRNVSTDSSVAGQQTIVQGAPKPTAQVPDSINQQRGPPPQTLPPSFRSNRGPHAGYPDRRDLHAQPTNNQQHAIGSNQQQYQHQPLDQHRNYPAPTKQPNQFQQPFNQRKFANQQHHESERQHFSRHPSDRDSRPFYGRDASAFRPNFNRGQMDEHLNTTDTDRNLNWAARSSGMPGATGTTPGSNDHHTNNQSHQHSPQSSSSIMIPPLVPKPPPKISETNLSLRPSHNLSGRTHRSFGGLSQVSAQPRTEPIAGDQSNLSDASGSKTDQMGSMTQEKSGPKPNANDGVLRNLTNSESASRSQAMEQSVNKFMAALNDKSEGLGSANLNRLAIKIRELKITKSCQHECLASAVKYSIPRSESDRESVGKLFVHLVPTVFEATSLMNGFKLIFEQMHALEVETPRVKSFVAGFVSQAIADNILSLEDLGGILVGGKHYPLFLLVLQKLEKSPGQAWLNEKFIASKINLIEMLPEVERKKERLASILKDRGLSFLDPMLTIEPDLWDQMSSRDASPASVYRWVKDNIDQSIQATPTFANVLISCLLKYIHQCSSDKVKSSGSSPGSSPSNSQTVSDLEKELLDKYQQVLQAVIKDKQMQLATLYAVQLFYYKLDFPKGTLLRWFHMLYDLNIVDDDVYFVWKEEINNEYPGKGQALFQVNTWLNWLAEAEDEEDEEEEDG